MQSYDTMKPKVKRKALCTFDFLQKVQLKYERKMRGRKADLANAAPIIP
jgi:hypothetical protein